MRSVCIVGAGVVGLWSALELRRRGVGVVVVDRADPGHGCSWGNAGWIVPSMSAPLPAPGVAWQSVRWLLGRDSPLYIRPRADAALWRWLWGFWRHCNPRDHARGLAALAGLHQGTMESFDALRRDGVRFEMHASGLLFVFESGAYFRHARDELRALERHGYDAAVALTASEARALEPALGPRVVGGLVAPGERHVRPESLVEGLVERLRCDGATIRSGLTVTGFRRDGARIVACESDAGPVAADQFLIAAGAWSGRLLAGAGYPIPLEAGKGYSLTLAPEPAAIGRPLYLSEARIACSPFEGALRFAGTMEFSGLNGEVDHRRLRAMEAGIARFLPGLLDGRAASDWTSAWTGARPMTPDGLPVIGRVPGLENLYVATGHAMLGVSLAPVTARNVAALMAGESVADRLRPFDPARFQSRNGARPAGRGSLVSTERSGR